MAIKALILDMDGTLVDSNDAHALAWQKSFGEAGFEVSLERINGEIGKGGDHMEGVRVVPTAPEVKAPVAARYAWSNMSRATLYNDAGLPASPFKTDSW